MPWTQGPRSAVLAWLSSTVKSERFGDGKYMHRGQMSLDMAYSVPQAQEDELSLEGNHTEPVSDSAWNIQFPVNCGKQVCGDLSPLRY